jgi:hypothetical protein
MTLANDLLQVTCCRKSSARPSSWPPECKARMQRVPPANLFPAPHIYTLSGRFDTAPRNDHLKRKVDAQRR